MSETAIERFERQHIPEPNSGCWLWLVSCFANGYGSFWNGERNVKAHRWSYEHHIGPIAKGMTIDHLCRVRSCVNPDHLEAVTNRENLMRGYGACAQNARKTHCIYGHHLTEDNVMVFATKRGPARQCKKCNRRNSRLGHTKRMAKKHALANTSREPK